MLKNYLKTAWRNLLRNRAFSAINISGLALGLACSLLILLWVQDERSVDNFHANGKNLYHIYLRQHFDGKVALDYPTQGLLAEELRRVIPDIQYASPLEWNFLNTFEAANKPGKMTGTFAGEDFFKMFSYPLLQGKAQSALATPEAVAISRKMAEFFFGSPEKAMGKTLRYENQDNLTVTAVFENISVHSSIQFDFLRSWKGFVKDNQWVHNWGNTDPMSFVQLRPGADPVKVEATIKDFIYRYREKDPNSYTEIGLQPYGEKYLHSTFKNGRPDGGRIEYVRLFSLVAVIIMLIACINFMNLATARSSERAREVGIRKVMGALRGALIRQFIGEAMLLTAIAVVIAVILVSLVLPAFNTLTGKELSLPVSTPAFWAILVALLILTGSVAGSYPAFFMSSLNPIRVLKGVLRSGRGASAFRRGLVVFQFTLSIVLIVSVIVIFRQMKYAQTKNLGYDRENLVYIPIEGELVKKYEGFKQQAERLPGILSVSNMREQPTTINHHVGDIVWTGKDPNLAISFANTAIGYDFVKTLHLQLREGRDFSTAFATDSAGFMVNEAAVRKMGLQYPVVGQPLTWGRHPGTIIGVLKDFHFGSMHKTIEPLVIRLNTQQAWGNILVRIGGGKTKEALAGLEKLCKDLNPKFPFTCQFSDQEYARLYRSEEVVVSSLTGVFAFLAIFISCLGLFGLATFTAGQRTKEIGVRKVLGASVPDIVRLLSANFLQPVALSLLIAFPLSWYAMNSWLQDYAYKINIEWWMFALAGALTIGIALLTIGFQSVRSAIANPVRSLRSE